METHRLSPYLVSIFIAGMIPFLALETTRPLDLRQDFSAAGIIAKSHEASFTTYVARVLCRAAFADDAPGDDRARLAGHRRCFRHRRRLRRSSQFRHGHLESSAGSGRISRRRAGPARLAFL